MFLPSKIEPEKPQDEHSVLLELRPKKNGARTFLRCGLASVHAFVCSCVHVSFLHAQISYRRIKRKYFKASWPLMVMDGQKLAAVLKTCISFKSLKEGKLLHQKIISSGLQSNIILCKYLINLYCSCHFVESARLVFDNIENPYEISLWNSLMATYSRSQLYTEALQLFEKLQGSSPPKPDNYTYPNALKACGGLGNILKGKKIHSLVIKDGFGFDVVVTSSLVSMYAKCKLFDSACKLFDEMPDRDVASWNTVISCYYQDGQFEKALELFDKMRKSGFKPNSVTFTTVISACARLSRLTLGKKIHEELISIGFHLDGFVSSAIVDMYAKCGCLEMAREVFEQISEKSVVSWNSMIGGYAVNGECTSCLELFLRMSLEGTRPTSTTLSSLLMACSRSASLPQGKFIHGYIIRNRVPADIFISTSLIDMYFECGCIEFAEKLFEKMPKANSVAWNVMISGYVVLGSYDEALSIFSTMRTSGVKPDSVTFTSILPAVSQLAALQQGREIHNLILEGELESNEVVGGALINMYAKCGALDDARRVFDQLPARDFVSWTAMIDAYGSHGQASHALELFQKMQKSQAKPDHVTFLAVISACSHAGLVDEGLDYFNQMTIGYGFKPKLEHYSSIIDLLGRAGRLTEAYDILKQIPINMRDAGLLGALVSACSLHGSLELGAEIGKLLLEKDPDDHSSYIALSNMYAANGRWEEVRKMRARIKEKGLKKNPGCSWIEINKKMHTFFPEDDTHPQTEVIYKYLEILNRHMEKEQQ